MKRPLNKVKKIVVDSLMCRGMTQGEANTYIKIIEGCQVKTKTIHDPHPISVNDMSKTEMQSLILYMRKTIKQQDDRFSKEPEKTIQNLKLQISLMEDAFKTVK